MRLKTGPLLFVQPGERRHEEWSEIGLDASLWRILGEKMKMAEIHMVPLSTQTVAILRELHPLTGLGRYVFPSIRAVVTP